MENTIRKYRKLFQYFMILVIIAAAVFLPPYAAKWQAAKAVGENSSGANQARGDGENSVTGVVENTQDGGAGEAADIGENTQSGGEDGTADVVENAESDGGEEVTQTGEAAQTIVVDPGHGGCQLRYGEVPLKSDVPGIGKQIL